MAFVSATRQVLASAGLPAHDCLPQFPHWSSYNSGDGGHRGFNYLDGKLPHMNCIIIRMDPHQLAVVSSMLSNCL